MFEIVGFTVVGVLIWRALRQNGSHNLIGTVTIMIVYLIAVLSFLMITDHQATIQILHIIYLVAGE